MVAKTPPKQQKRMAMAAVPLLNPILLRETVKKVDRCMERLQELQCTVSGGTKVISGKTLSPRSTRGYLRTSIRCKQESLRLKNSGCRKSPVGKFQGCAVGGGEWRRMSLPAMLVGETVGEILQASQFAKQVVVAVTAKTTKKIATAEPKTPVTDRRNQKIINCENTELRSRRKKEKQVTLKLIRSESDSPTSLPRARARARINFKVVSPNKRAEIGKENWHIANRVSPKNRPWAKKTVLFPNPLFNNLSPTSQKKRFCKTKSPVISRGAASRQTPHKFVIKSPTATSKFQVKIKSPPVSLSPTRPIGLYKKSPTKISTASKLRRSFSPSRLANRLVSPLKNRMAAQKSSVGLVSGLKQQPLATTTTTPVRFLDRKI